MNEPLATPTASVAQPHPIISPPPATAWKVFVAEGDDLSFDDDPLGFDCFDAVGYPDIVGNLEDDPEPDTIQPPGEPRISLTDYVDSQVSYYRSLGTEAADLIARTLIALRQEIVFFRARSVLEYLDRKDAQEAGLV
jgi:hypothetical protein